MRAHVIVVDRHNYTLFQPLFNQVATAVLSPADVATPIRPLLHGSNIEMLLDQVDGVEPERGPPARTYLVRATDCIETTRFPRPSR